MAERRHRRYPLLPDDPEIGWAPYLWLVYLGFFAIDPYFSQASPAEWLLLAGVIAIFLPLYFAGYWAKGTRQLLLVVAAITLLAVVYLPFNFSAWGLFLYAGAFVGFIAPPGRALSLVALLCGIVLVEGLLLDLPVWAWASALVMTAILGGTNIHFAEVQRKNAHLRAAREEVERLAQSAERERIGRDLHDLLGHTLTVIAVKAELAAKLADRDPERSRAEIREVHRISRQALAEVRRAVSGYRSGTRAGLAHELASARGALESAEVAAELEIDPEAAAAVAAAGDAVESGVALALREAVTNVLRHAHARRCRIELEAAAGRLRLRVIDDGLRGMRERIEALGGTVRRRSVDGTRLKVEVPIPPQDAPGDATAEEPRRLPAPA